ncbi:N-acetyltransferase [Leptospira fluminis]|uniref:N-acetyltransferase n=1 Tax=Leptospira fluminis TaxID=2484979 RepID=A0A4R9GNN1_9LEPT|nr:N-acetyltransferase [Leptospira fluminis]
MLNLRRAQKEDLLLLFDWANDPETRKAAFNSEQIPIEKHTSWFLGKLAHVDSDIYILEYNNISIGQVRFDKREEDGAFLIDYSIDLKYRGRGFGSEIIALGLRAQTEKFGKAPTFVAFVKKQNVASQKCFLKVGFRQESSESEFVTYKYSERYEK